MWIALMQTVLARQSLFDDYVFGSQTVIPRVFDSFLFVYLNIAEYIGWHLFTLTVL